MVSPDQRSQPHSGGRARGFAGLPYYPMDPALQFEERTLDPYAGAEPCNFQIPTSDGKLRPAHRAGVLAFDLDGAPRQLTAYTFDGGDGASLFVPFLDETSGTETYGHWPFGAWSARIGDRRAMASR